MTDSSRAQGGLICVAVAVLAACFLLGLLQQSYWAIAIPVAVVVFCAPRQNASENSVSHEYAPL